MFMQKRIWPMCYVLALTVRVSCRSGSVRDTRWRKCVNGVVNSRIILLSVTNCSQRNDSRKWVTSQ